MKNELKLALIIFGILMTAVGFGWAFNLSLNPQTFQVGYTVYSQAGQKINGFIPNNRMTASSLVSSAAACPSSCPNEPNSFAIQCREQGHKVYNGPCCESLCSGNVAQANGGMNL